LNSECGTVCKGRNAQLRSTLGQAQRALLGNISDALAAMSAAQNAFDHPKTPPQLGSDPVNILTVVQYQFLFKYFIEAFVVKVMDRMIWI